MDILRNNKKIKGANVISVPLFLEYESVSLRDCVQIPLEKESILDILNYLAQVVNKRDIFFLWRPHLKVSKDDLVLEIAVESESKVIVTYNKKRLCWC